MEEEINNQQPAVQDEGTEEGLARLMSLEKKEKLEELKKMALEHGIKKAVSLAKRMNDPYLLDELHDALVDELKNHLISRGKLEEL